MYLTRGLRLDQNVKTSSAVSGVKEAFGTKKSAAVEQNQPEDATSSEDSEAQLSSSDSDGAPFDPEPRTETADLQINHKSYQSRSQLRSNEMDRL